MVTRCYTADGVKIRDYEMISNYWFPSIPLFAQDPDALPAGTKVVSPDDDDVTRYYNTQGMEISEPQSGEIVIIRRGSRTFKKVM